MAESVTRAVAQSVTTTRDIMLRDPVRKLSLSHCHRHCRREHLDIDTTHTRNSDANIVVR